LSTDRVTIFVDRKKRMLEGWTTKALRYEGFCPEPSD
jgi:hypothetical protein